MLYTRDNTIRLINQYMASLRTCTCGKARLAYIKRINELQEDLSNDERN